MHRLVSASALAVTSCLIWGSTSRAAAATSAETVIAPQPSTWSEPANVGKAKLQAEDYIKSGAYMRDFAAADAEAETWIDQRAGQVKKPAIVLDIDETSLSNTVEEKANDFGFVVGGSCDDLPRGPCGFTAWEKRADATVLEPTLRLYKDAQAHHVAVFFITGRQKSLRAVTAQNLLRAGYSNWSGLYLAPDGHHFSRAEDFKAPVRAEIEGRGYVIVATIGDQISDLVGGHADRGYKLPNPFYYLP